MLCYVPVPSQSLKPDFLGRIARTHPVFGFDLLSNQAWKSPPTACSQFSLSFFKITFSSKYITSFEDYVTPRESLHQHAFSGSSFDYKRSPREISVVHLRPKGQPRLATYVCQVLEHRACYWTFVRVNGLLN